MKLQVLFITHYYYLLFLLKISKVIFVNSFIILASESNGKLNAIRRFKNFSKQLFKIRILAFF